MQTPTSSIGVGLGRGGGFARLGHNVVASVRVEVMSPLPSVAMGVCHISQKSAWWEIKMGIQ